MQIMRTPTEEQAKRVAMCGDIALLLETYYGPPPKDWVFKGCIFCKAPEAADIISGIINIQPEREGALHRFNIELPTSATGTKRPSGLFEAEGSMLRRELDEVARGLIDSLYHNLTQLA